MSVRTKKSPKLAPALFTAAALIGAGVAAVSAYARTHNFRGPRFLAHYLATPNSLVGPLFPTRQVKRAAIPREFPTNLSPIDQVVPWQGEWRGLHSVLGTTKTNAIMVAKDGVLVHSWFREGYTPATPVSSWSIAKSVVSLVTGQLIDEGRLSEDTRLTEILPEYATGGPFDTITVGHLLDMKSGIDLSEEYVEWKAYEGVGGMVTTLDLPAYLQQARNTYAVPGAVLDYRSIDTQFLSMMIARVENAPLAEVVHNRLWNPLGALDNATWSLDHEGGTEKGFMGLNASPRDFLKVGQLVADRGRVGDTQVVSEAWIERISTPVGVNGSPDLPWGYAAQWWHPTGSETHGDLTAVGVYGQYIYVSPKTGTVIVKISDHASNEYHPETIEVFRAIAER